MAIYSLKDFEEAYAIMPPREGFYRSYVKRVFDIGFVVAIALPVAFVVAVLALIIAADGKSPFYLQKRVGRNGKTFNMIKLRSMVPNAEKELRAHLRANPDLRREWDEKQKLSNDPRITRIGRFIRKSSLDELPQFWNVLRGDMSVVGPRPMMVDQTQLYPGTAYYALRPGITGFWQISERNECSFAERALHDTHYHRALSFGTDLTVVMRTVFVVAAGTGV
ncbi:sugar transferase [Shimia abyssi]|nr:sugar transferase [Shimia abyssi]